MMSDVTVCNVVRTVESGNCLDWRRCAREASEIYMYRFSVLVVESKRTGWAGHVARMEGEERRVRNFGGET